MFRRIDVDQFRREIPRNLFEEWLAFYSIDPWDGERDDLLAGIIASTIGNVNRDSKKHPTPYVPSDFSPDWLADPNQSKAQTQAELNSNASDLVAAIRSMRGNRDEKTEKPEARPMKQSRRKIGRKPNAAG